MQNEYYYKNRLNAAITKFISEITADDNELGWIAPEIENNMTEAAWLVLKQNYNLNQYLKQERLLK